MKYLHNTAVRFHGNLTSSRCVIDSHWVVKITDWGLHAFKAGQEKVNVNPKKVYTGTFSRKKDVKVTASESKEWEQFCFCSPTFDHF